MAERWLPVVGYEGLYEVSDLGNVNSLRRKGGNNRWYGGGRKKPTVGDNGYPEVALYRQWQGATIDVHVLVARAFIGECPVGQEVRHKDGNRLNPAATNLLYGTHAENMQDMARHGTGRQPGCSKGHPFDYTASNGKRICRTCRNATVRRYYARRKAAA